MRWDNKYYAVNFRIYYTPTIIIVVSLGLSIIGLISLYAYWKSTVDQYHGYNSVDSLIGVIGIVLSVITIIFIYITYQAQRKQIEDNTKNTEFNRILDLMYRQVEVSNQKYGDITKEKSFPKITEITNIKDAYPHMTTIGWLLRIYLKDLEVIDNFLKKTNLTQEEQNLLVSTFTNNIDKDLKGVFSSYTFHHTIAVYFGTNISGEYEGYLNNTVVADIHWPGQKQATIINKLSAYDEFIKNKKIIDELHKKYEVRW